MRNSRVLTAVSVALVLILVTVIPVLAGSTTKQLSTNFTLVNLGDGPAQGTIEYFLTDGSVWGPGPGSEDFEILEPGGQAIFRQYFPPGSAGNPGLDNAKGSAVVSADQPLGAVVQIQARGQNPTSNGAYSGFREGDSSFFIPIVARNKATASGLGNSQIIVQNVGSIPADIEIDMVNSDGSPRYTASTSSPVQPGASFYYDLADESATNIPNDWIGSAAARTTTSGASIAVVSNFFTGHAMQTFNGFSSSAPGTQFFVPLFTSRLPNSLSTPVTVQNLSGSTIGIGQVELSCTSSDGAFAPITRTNDQPILHTASYAWNPVVDLTIPTGFLGSCVINSSADVVAFVQLRFIAQGEAAAHEALPGGGTESTAFIPLVAKRLPNGFSTAVTIQNLSPITVTMDLTYNPSPEYTGSSTPVEIPNLEVGPYASLIQNHRITSGSQAVPQLPDGWQGSLVVESDAAVGSFVQLTFLRAINPALPGGDNFMAHNAFAQ